jgi:quercetin dioxygenase-like cupin family protein
VSYSRRELSALIPLLATATTNRLSATTQALPSKVYEFGNLPVKTNPDTHNESRSVFDGLTHSGVNVEMHITTLMPGLMPHPEHSHDWEEMMMLQAGTLEVTIQDKKVRIGPGSVVYIYSNEQHGLKNVGDTPAQYFVLAIGRLKT